MILEEIVVRTKLGFHLRPATMFASVAQGFSSDIKISYNGRVTTGKSAIGLLKLEIEEGERIFITIDGEDEIEAMKTLTQLLNSDLI